MEDFSFKYLYFYLKVVLFICYYLALIYLQTDENTKNKGKASFG